MQKDIVVIVGGGIMQIRAVEEAQAMGYKVLVTDFCDTAPARKICDYFVEVSTRDWEKTIALLQPYKERLKGILTVGTDFTYTVAKVAQHYGLPGVSPEVAYMATNKGAMRKRLKECGVPCPDFVRTKDVADVVRFSEEIGFPFVIKPADNMGARGVKKIEKAEDIDDAFLAAKDNSIDKTVIAEEYMSGPEISIDTIVSDNKLYPLTIADRIIKFPPYFIEIGHTIPSELTSEQLADVVNVMEKGIKALGIDNCPSKGDIRVTKDGAKIGEMTVRLSGGFHSQYTDPLATGMRSIKAAIDLACGNKLDLQDITPKYEKASAERAILPGFGKIKDIQGVSEACAVKGVAKVILNVSAGDTLYPFTSNMGKAGHVIASGSSRDEAVAAAEEALECIKFNFE